MKIKALIVLTFVLSPACQPRPLRDLADSAAPTDSARPPFERPAAPAERPDVLQLGDAQITDSALYPPVGKEALQAWLLQRHYRDTASGMWFCEPAPHRARPPSPHQFVRVCINQLLASTPDGTPFPVGSCAVKELFESDLRTQIGWAVSVRVTELAPAVPDGGYDGAIPQPNAGTRWYWYERLRPGTIDNGLPFAIEPDGTLANGLSSDLNNNSGVVCASCHVNAGTDGGVPFGHHFVFTTEP